MIFGIDLCEDGAQAACKVLCSGGGIDNQGVLFVRVRQGQDESTAENPLQMEERFHGLGRHLAPFCIWSLFYTADG